MTDAGRAADYLIFVAARSLYLEPGTTVRLSQEEGGGATFTLLRGKKYAARHVYRDELLDCDHMLERLAEKHVERAIEMLDADEVLHSVSRETLALDESTEED